jgi:hypothetical protein
MKKLVPIPPKSLKRLQRNDVKDFGYQFVSVKLKDGRVFARAVASVYRKSSPERPTSQNC